MKTSVILLSIAAALSLQAAETPSTSSRAPVVLASAYRGMPWLDNSRLPWLNHVRPTPPSAMSAQADPALTARKLDTLLATLNDDLANTENTLTALTSKIDSTMMPGEYGPVEPAFPPIPAADYSALASRDLSTMQGQDLSLLASQNLSTSLAVPTALPWCPWANKQGLVAVAAPAGTMVGPAFPPRTAWGNGPGVVATTPGGAVYAMVPETQRAADAATSTAIREVQRQLETVQNEIVNIRPLLENLSTNRLAVPPTLQQPILTPTGRR